MRLFSILSLLCLSTLFLQGEATPFVGTAAAVVSAALALPGAYQALTSNGCWPRNIDSKEQVHKGNYKTLALAEQAIEKYLKMDPTHTLCEKTGGLVYGGTVKCVKGDYQGVNCGKGDHQIIWDPKYYNEKQLTSDMATMLAQHKNGRDDVMGDLIQRSEVKDVTEVKATASGFWGFRTWNLQAFDANGDLIVQINKNYGSLGNAKKLQDFMAALLKKGYKLTTSQLKELRKKMSIGIGNMLGTASMLGKAGLEVYNGDFMALKKFYDSNPDDKMLISSDLPALRQQHEDYIVDQDIKLY